MAIFWREMPPVCWQGLGGSGCSVFCQTWYYTWGYVTDCVLSTFHKWHIVQYRRVIITVIARDGICQTYSMVLNMGLGDRLRAVRISLAAKTNV